MYSTNVSEEEIREGVEDAHGILYSKDGKKLLSIKDNDNIDNPYTVKMEQKSYVMRLFMTRKFQVLLFRKV